MIRRVIFSIMFSVILVSCATDTSSSLNSVSAEEFSRIMEEENGVQVLDVRTESEYLKGHLPNALNINIRDTAFHSRVLELLEKDRPVAVYCRSGNRSKVAGAILVNMGYEVYELNSGVVGWTGKVEY